MCPIHLIRSHYEQLWKYYLNAQHADSHINVFSFFITKINLQLAFNSVNKSKSVQPINAIKHYIEYSQGITTAQDC